MMKILYFIFIIFLLLKDVTTKYVGDVCSPDGIKSNGICKMVKDCEAAISSLKKIHEHPFTNCGFIGFDQIVCCPTQTNDPGAPEEPRYNINEANQTRIAERECEKIKAFSFSYTLPQTTLFIIGGETTNIGEFPHMVALGYKDVGSDDYSFNCGGSLISDTFVLTASHCAYNIARVKPTIIRAGVTNISGKFFNNNSDYKIKDIILYPERNGTNKYHDILLMRLERPIKRSKNLNAICLHTSEENPTVPLTVTGWGTTSSIRDVRSATLMKANVTVVLNSECKKTYENWPRLPNNIIDKQICAGDPNGRDTCKGDSGGPLQGLTSNDGYYRLVGITSFGDECGSSKPAVYTRVAAYLDWIESVVWSDSIL